MDWVVSMMVQYPEYAALAIIGPYYVAGVVAVVGLLLMLVRDA